MVDTFSHHYLYKKRDVFYFSRHVPNDVREHYRTKRIAFSLRTKSKTAALRASKSIAQKLEDYWMSLRLDKLDIPAHHLIKQVASTQRSSEAPLISEALKTYLRLKGTGKDKTFRRASERNIEYVIEALGDRPIDQYASSDEYRFRVLRRMPLT